MTVSAALLVLDPPLDRLAMLLACVRHVVSDTVIVVDDRTRPEAVATMSDWEGVTLVPLSWCDDFAAARNAALPHCRGDWVLHVDPDEMPTGPMLDFVRMVDASPREDASWRGCVVPAPRGYLFLAENYEGGVRLPEWEEHWHCRLFRRDAGRWYKPVHEQVMLEAMPESHTRGTPLLPKAPRGAYLINSRMNDPKIDAVYAAIGERGVSGAVA